MNTLQTSGRLQVGPQFVKSGRIIYLALLFGCSLYGSARIATAVPASPAAESAKSPLEALFDAIKSRDQKAIEGALQDQVDINARNREGKTPLLLAISTRQAAVVTLLLDKGANPSLTDANGTPPLMQAVLTKNLEITKILLDRKVPVDVRDDQGQTSLMGAIRSQYDDLAEFLLAHGADINAVDKEGFSALARAASGDEVLSVDFILKHGGKLPAKGPAAELLLGYFAEHGDGLRVESLLKSGVNPNAPRSDSDLADTPLGRAAAAGELVTLKLLVEHGAEVNGRDMDGTTPLIYAFREKHLEIARYLLSKGASAATKNRMGQGPIAALIEASPWGEIELIDLLLRNRANINEGDSYGKTLLMMAAESKDLKTVKFLIARGANINQARKDRETALTLAADEYFPFATVNFLLSHGATLPPKGRQRELVLIRATQGGNLGLVRKITALGVNLNTRDNQGWTPLMLSIGQGKNGIAKFLLSKGAKVTVDKQGHTSILASAASEGDQELVGLLLRHGVKIDARDPETQDTALHAAAQQGRLDTVRFLLAKGAHINLTNIDGSTPLILAAANYRVPVAQLLLSSGADATIRDKHGKTALDWARLRTPALVSVLEKATKRSTWGRSKNSRP